MAALRGVLAWLGRKGIVFVALVAAILVYWWIGSDLTSFSRLRATAVELSEGKKQLDRFAARNIDRGNRQLFLAQRLSGEAIDVRIASAKREQARLGKTCGTDLAALVTNGAEGVIRNREACLLSTLRTREIATLNALKDSLTARRVGENMDAALERHRLVIATTGNAPEQYRRLDEDWIPDAFQKSELKRALDRILALNAAKRSRTALLVASNARANASRAAESAWAKERGRFTEIVNDSRKALSENLLQRARAWAEANNLAGAMKWAAVALAAMIVSPLLIRLFCYFVLAPAAMRRPAIKLNLPGPHGTIPPASSSAASVGVRLADGEELLLRQDYLQTSSFTGEKTFKMFLDWRHPFTSIAAGLIFLTRIRGEGEVTTVSATRDPLAEVTILTLPEGAACSLQPRALAAVVQPIARPLRIRTQWRAGTLNAWLTLQLRHVIFHGPAKLIIKGNRGVRVEQAERGRVFGQDQLIGFSADLAYAVTRTETLPPYLFGRESLFKDRVDAGGGVLIVEEAPLSGARGGRRRGGIEGLFDAGLKAFGL